MLDLVKTRELLVGNVYGSLVSAALAQALHPVAFNGASKREGAGAGVRGVG